MSGGMARCRRMDRPWIGPWIGGVIPKLSAKQFDFMRGATEARGYKLRFPRCSGGVQQKLEDISCTSLVAQAPALCFASQAWRPGTASVPVWHTLLSTAPIWAPVWQGSLCNPSIRVCKNSKHMLETSYTMSTSILCTIVLAHFKTVFDVTFLAPWWTC